MRAAGKRFQRAPGKRRREAIDSESSCGILLIGCLLWYCGAVCSPNARSAAPISWRLAAPHSCATNRTPCNRNPHLQIIQQVRDKWVLYC